MWVTDSSFAADWLLWPGTFTSPNLSFLICGMRWLEWIIYKVLSRGAGGRMSFPSLWLPSGQSSQPSPPPTPSCAGSSGGWARHMFLCSKFFVLSEGVLSDGQAYSCEPFFICAVFFCTTIWFLMVAVLQNWFCCLLRITVCHPVWKVADVASNEN